MNRIIIKKFKKHYSVNNLQASRQCFKAFNFILKDVYSNSFKSNKRFYPTNDFNLNIFDSDKNEKVTKYLNLIFEYNLVPIINKPIQVTKNTVTAMDHIITNSLLHNTID